MKILISFLFSFAALTSPLSTKFNARFAPEKLDFDHSLSMISSEIECNSEIIYKDSDGTLILNQYKIIELKDIFKLLSIDQSTYSFVLERETKSVFEDQKIYRFYQQYYKGVKVDGGSFLIKQDIKTNQILSISPHIYRDIKIDTSPLINKDLAQIICLERFKNGQIQNLSLILTNIHAGKFKLVYDVILNENGPKHIHIDAHTGIILNAEACNIGISATTRNYGTVSINDFIQNGVRRLQTPSENIKIYQGLNIGMGTPANPTQWTESNIPSTTSNTSWDNDANMVARQARFVTEKVVDKYQEKLGLTYSNVNISIQETGAETLPGSTLNNSYIIIGNLSNSTPVDGPNYALYDVIAHELGHVNLFQYLDYDDAENNKSLHEGLADVFGTYIENYIKSGGTDWVNSGDDAEVAAFLNRDYRIKACLTEESIPHSRGKSVSHWFYAISQGINEPSTNTIIPAIGIETSMSILREALNTLNFKKAGIEYFAHKTLNIAAAQYTVNSPEYEAVSKAWSRVCVTPLCANVPDITVTSGQNITYSSASTFSHITIQSGGKLTLLNNNFHVLVNKVITVQNGGELSVSGTITSCGINEAWKGIKIETGGRLNVINNLEISNAVSGIQADPNAIININGQLHIVGNSVSNTGISLTGNSSLTLGQGIDISNCKTGILLTDAEQIDLSSFTKKISNCEVGVHALGGHVDLKNFEFDNCSRPIVLKNAISSVFIADNIIEGSFYTGIDVEACNDVIIENNIIGSLTQRGYTGIQSYFSNVYIYNQNHIYTTGRCINSTESTVYVSQNYLDVSGIVSSKVKGNIISGANKEDSEISNNYLVAKGANYGIFSEYESKTYINNNDLDFKLPNGSGAASIDVSGVIDGNVDGNIVDGDAWAKGIQLQNTMGTAIQCNEVINANVSLNILHNSDNHSIKANTLTGTDDLNIRSVIGPQPAEGFNHHGNKFEGGTVKAIGLSDDEILDSRFRVQPSTPYLPPNRTPVIGWFIPEANKPMESCASLQIAPGPDWTPDPMRLCTYYAYLKTIKDSLPERFFINVFHLLKYELLNPGFTLPPCIKNDSTLAQLCGIKKLAEISFVLDTLGIHKSLTKDVRMLRNQYLESNNPVTKQSLEQSIKSEWTSIYTKLPAAKLKDSLALDSLKSELNKLLCDSLVYKWKEIYKLYIDFKQNTTVMPIDTAAIKAYSSECAALYGDAIHLARIMAATFSDQDYSVHDDCIAFPTPRIKQDSVVSNDIMLYPNPSHGLVRIQVPKHYLGQLTVSNTYGIVLTKRSIHNEEIIDLDLSSFSGVNILRFETIQGEINTIKVIILN